MQRIVVAAKAGAEEAFLADAARQLAQDTGGEVTVVSVDGVEMAALSPLPSTEYSEQARRSAELIAGRLREAGVDAKVQVRSGRPVRGILEAADEIGADIIVAGASARGPVATRLLGDVSLELAQRARRPVLIVSRPGS